MNTENLKVLKTELDNGRAILTAGSIHEDIPTIHMISNRDGAVLKVDSEVKHLGFGCFQSHVLNDTIIFDGGGAMNRLESFSYCVLSAKPAQLVAMGYDMRKVKNAVDSLIAFYTQNPK